MSEQNTNSHAAKNNINGSIFARKRDIKWQTPNDERPAQLFGTMENTGTQNKSDEPTEAEYVVDKGGYDSGKTVTVPPSNGKRKGTTQSSISVTDSANKRMRI